MSQIKALQNLLKTKADLIITQRDKLHGALDGYVSQITSKLTELLETREQNVKTLTETSLVMETVLLYLMDIVARMEDGAMEPLSTDTDFSTDTTSSLSPLTDMPTATSTRKLSDTDDNPIIVAEATALPSTLSSPSSLSSSSPMLHKKSHGSETEEMFKLQHRIEALESGLIACRNEMSQTTTQMTHAKDQLDTRCLRLEEKVQLLTNQNQETEKKRAVKFESMDKKIGECERQSQENDQRLANLENHTKKLDDVVKKVEEISTQLDKHERPAVPARVGFTAYYPEGIPSIPRIGSRITDFTNVFCNEGNHYNLNTGEFICPIDGLYLVSATLWKWEDGIVRVNIKCQCGGTATPPKDVCVVNTNQSKTSSCGMGVVRLKTGDRVYVEVGHKSGDPELSHFSSFSCVLVT